ncbi:hypothetical protein AVEN_56260-1 [Araneus ventricosus]|uniref:Uncharacterized protein n=1 Tax=Araneus ventricosus TaxID=182803 RepID=A0A4Y2FWP3_ARAVE|nr:hypothetical protein AVEN_56260-1 [Araneus ventricosus]
MNLFQFSSLSILAHAIDSGSAIFKKKTPTPPLQPDGPQLDQVQESTCPQKSIGERFMEKEESAASVSTDLGRPREEV